MDVPHARDRRTLHRTSRGGPNVELCQYYEEYDRSGTDAAMAHGIYSLDDLKAFGKEKGWCPYFLARHVINHASILIYNYQYVLDPKVAGLVSKELEAESIVVFDEVSERAGVGALGMMGVCGPLTVCTTHHRHP